MGALRMYTHRGGIGGSLVKLGTSVIKKLPGVAVRSLPGAGAIGAVGGAALGGLIQHPFKTGYQVGKKITGSVERTFGLGEPRKKYRRMNPMNFRALKRAVRRVDAAEKAFRSVLRVVKPRQASSSIIPKARTRRK
jgi:hypothetical protein